MSRDSYLKLYCAIIYIITSEEIFRSQTSTTRTQQWKEGRKRQQQPHIVPSTDKFDPEDQYYQNEPGRAQTRL